ncbi:N/N'-diacetyllegionaminate synthase [Synechococcus sp. Minos11]|uniref:N-acetylneuraminate synthase family protein n=1 Tax=Synechococcus sp. Minos11 TaxID=221341 RepID=UPI0016478A3E|nr:N-acetylneuraminate synthase family protein [Synechococcus sp. Minos11]QNJ07689.1 N/N'-diacetyllegionaminate synthase [Synechococcus sp. Minos11]
MKFIAELCQNHGGKFDNVLRMADAAAASGATHIKLQHIYVKNLTYRSEFETGFTSETGQLESIKRPWKAEYNRLKQLELTDQECRSFVKHVQSLGCIPMTTCFAKDSIPSLLDQGFRVVKVASYDCASYSLLRELAKSFDELYISTGATHSSEVLYAAELLHSYNIPFSLLHCVTLYPTPLDQMHLNRISWLKNLVPSVGFSDHSSVQQDGLVAAKAAVYCGADFVERHFILDDLCHAKDAPVSITPHHLCELLDFNSLSRDDQLGYLNKYHPSWKDMLGSADRSLTPGELLNRDYYRGRFASPIKSGAFRRSEMIFNWEETPC